MGWCIADPELYHGLCVDPKLSDVVNGLVSRAVRTQARLQGVDRASGERMLRSRAAALEAFGLFLDTNAGAALRAHVKVCIRTPQIPRSPLTRPMVLQPMSRCLGGSVGIQMGRRVSSWMNQRRGRELDFSVRSTVDSDGRAGGQSEERAAPADLRR